MLVLNLLNDGQKKQVKARKTNIIIKKIIFVCLTMSVIIALLLLAAQMFAQKNLKKIEDLGYMSDNQFNNEITRVNELAKFIKKINQNNKYWSDVLIEIAHTGDSNVRLSSIQIDTENKSVLIKGIANTRDDLLNLKKNMENSHLFTNIYIPIQNLVNKTDASFNLKADVDN